MGIWSEFGADLSKAARACWKAPMLPIISVVLILPADATFLLPGASEKTARGIAELLSIPLTLFAVGWLGTQRLWFQRIFDGGSLSLAEVWRLSWAFFGRFLVLGLIAGIPAYPVLLWFGVQVATGSASAAHPFMRPVWWIPFWLTYGFAADVALTFVTSALVYTTRRVREAWRIGVRLILETWPASAAYALMPPITLLALASLNPADLSPWMVLLLVAITGIVGLVTKGAIASYYLRHQPRLIGQRLDQQRVS